MNHPSRVTARVIAALSLALVGACSASLHEVLTPDDQGGDGGGTLDGATSSGDGAHLGDGASSGDASDYCSGSGPPVLGTASAGGGDTCASGLARGTFRYALCTCEGIVANDTLVTDSFDSTAGAYDPSKAKVGGGVGTNGSINVTTLTVGGALWASSTAGVTFMNHTQIGGELHAGGRVNGGLGLNVGGDAFVNGDVVTQGDLAIKGTLHVPNGATVSATGTKTIGATVNGAVSVPPACDCTASEIVDVTGFVTAHATDNDDARAGIDPQALENVGADQTVTLPCGRLYFTHIGGQGAMRLAITGRTAIFVQGDLKTQGAFTVDVPTGTEVDLFVGGNVVSGSTFELGASTNPSNARLYVGGTGTINLVSAATIAGNVYAPRAELVLGSTATIFGAAFVRRLATPAALAIHYDEAILAKGADCPPAPNACSTCHDCGNQACVNGACGDCRTGADCCSPLICQSGRCVAGLR